MCLSVVINIGTLNTKGEGPLSVSRAFHSQEKERVFSRGKIGNSERPEHLA